MTTRSLTWSTTQKAETNSLAHQFPSFQLNAADVRRGAVKVEARSPSGRVHDMGVIDNNGVYTANFTPSEVGDWNISIMYDGIHIQGSPFSVRVYDAAQVKVFGLEGGSVGRMFAFSVDTAGAGEGELDVTIMHQGSAVPVQMQAEGRGMYRVSFTPEGSGIYTIKVFFAGMEVTGSPYTLEIVDSSMVTASGEGLSSVEVNRRSTFIVNTGQKGSSSGDIRVHITSPRGSPIPCDVINNGDGTYAIEYTASDVGEYVIDVYYYGKPIAGSPFRVHAFDWNKITLKNLPGSGVVGKLCQFEIDAQNSGSGNLEIMVNEGTIKCNVINNGNRQFHATFVPKDAIPHFIQMRFNGREVPGSPWRVNVTSPAQISMSGAGLKSIPVHKPATFDVHTGLQHDYGSLGVNITSPTGRPVSSRVANNYNGSFTVEYTPTEVGNYQIELAHNDVITDASPFIAKAYDPGAIVVGQISSGVVGSPVEFTIDVTQAGEGQLEIMVNRGAVANKVKMLRKGVFLVSFVPGDTRAHVVDVKFNGQLLPRCPISVPILDASRVTVQGDGLRQVAVGKQSQFRVTTQSAGDADLKVRVTAPSGELVPAKIVQQPDGDFKVEYSSKFTGRHTVEILYAGQAIMGSPFYVEIYDPNKIKVLGAPNSHVGQRVEFEIVSHEAGKAELALSILSPTAKTLPYESVPTSLGERVSYIPTEAGPHNIYITYGGLEVPGNPITQNIVDSGSGVTVYGEGLSKAEVGRKANFYVDSKGHRGEITHYQVDGPNSYAKCHIEPEGPGRYLFSYVPLEVGQFTVMLKWNNRELASSPYRVRVVDSRQVRVIGGWDSHLDVNRQMMLVMNQTKRIEFDVSGAGPGRLTAEVQAAGGLIVPTYIEQRDNIISCTFTPTIEGAHLIKLNWNDFALPNSPFHGVCRAHVKQINHEKVILTGRGLREARLREEAEFVIDGTEAGPGQPLVTLTGVKADIDVMVTPLGDNKFKCSYVAHSVGAYLLNIMWSDRQVKGSPFKVNVITTGDASKVVAVGEGLKLGVMGREIKATIDTRRAGPGELTAQCSGPSKVAYCELFDHRDGTFTLSVKPQEPGKHLLQIKYGGEHVPGSPFTLKISGAPDASKVRVRGPGIEHGILATYKSHFICETKGAGAGQLTVRVRGPKGAFRVEMERDSQQDRTIRCRYDPTEVGDYVVSVRWSGQHVPGSPFRVHIFDTASELSRYAADQPLRRHGTMQADAGWQESL